MKSALETFTGSKAVYSIIRANNGIDPQRMLQFLQKILVIVGPTAVGKSALAVQLARRFNGEVISADSRQVYKGLDIGTGKITKREMCGVRHHLLDVASPYRQYSVVRYVKEACSAISRIVQRGKLPIVCGGTGLYIDALLGIVRFPNVPPNPALRKKLEKKTSEELFAMLQKLAPARAAIIDRRNSRRLLRALEIAHSGEQTSLTYSNIPQNIGIEYQPLFIGLTLPREQLRRNIAARLSARIRAGMIAEVKKLHRQGLPVPMARQTGLSWKRMEELGLEYRYISRYLHGLFSKKEMVEKLHTESWRYAKRQIAWFKRNKKIKWFSPEESQKISSTVKNFLNPGYRKSIL